MEVVMVPRDQSVADLVQAYADGIITYAELGQIFRERGWSTNSLWENTRHIEPLRTIWNTQGGDL